MSLINPLLSCEKSMYSWEFKTCHVGIKVLWDAARGLKREKAGRVRESSNLWLPGSSTRLQQKNRGERNKVRHRWTDIQKRRSKSLEDCMKISESSNYKSSESKIDWLLTHLVFCWADALSGSVLLPSLGALKSLSYMKKSLFCHHKSS